MAGGILGIEPIAHLNHRKDADLVRVVQLFGQLSVQQAPKLLHLAISVLAVQVNLQREYVLQRMHRLVCSRGSVPSNLLEVSKVIRRYALHCIKCFFDFFFDSPDIVVLLRASEA
jgi:hypothetical protein